jgi:uncharacterized membrane protein YkvA (DUF1232 family)
MTTRPTVLTRIQDAAKQLKRNITALYFAYRDPRTPWYAKALALLIIVYALSPIDLIPDFIPVLGYLDDLILLPLGIWLALRIIPAEVMVDAREQAVKHQRIEGPWGRLGAALIIGIYLLIALWIGFLFYRYQLPG